MGGKKVKGRKRHIGVDFEGRSLWVDVTAANVHDTNAGVYLLDGLKIKHHSIQRFCAVGGYQGDARWYSKILLKTPVEIPKKAKYGFAVLPKRWIVERTFAWLSNFRRLSKDYEINPRYSENMVRLSMLRLILAQFCNQFM